jgi:predicted Rossmann fold flavoprotein
LKTEWSGIASLKGVRANCAITILRDGKVFSSGTGEIQFTDYGISGPVVFEISRDVCYGAGEWIARLDFLPSYDVKTLQEALSKRCNADLPGDELLTGILHNRLGKVLTRMAGIRESRTLPQLTLEELERVSKTVKGFELALTEPMGMDSAQVTAGGVQTADFDPETLESKLVPGLYACGEVLDVDGDCGGYNLQWAWSSGCLAGYSAGKEVK